MIFGTPGNTKIFSIENPDYTTGLSIKTFSGIYAILILLLLTHHQHNVFRRFFASLFKINFLSRAQATESE